MIVKHSRETSKSAANTGLAKVAVQCSADTFVVHESMVLRINICGENRHFAKLRTDAKPSLSFCEKQFEQGQ